MSLIEGPPDTTIDSPARTARCRPTRFRWVICTLLFFATTVNYVDRSVLSVLAPTLKQKIHWTDTQYGYINAAFTGAYAVGLLAGGENDRRHRRAVRIRHRPGLLGDFEHVPRTGANRLLASA